MKLLNNNKEILKRILRNKMKSLHYFLSYVNPFDNITDAFDAIFFIDDHAMYSIDDHESYIGSRSHNSKKI